jgi:hypothetical protein
LGSCGQTRDGWAEIEQHQAILPFAWACLMSPYA